MPKDKHNSSGRSDNSFIRLLSPKVRLLIFGLILLTSALHGLSYLRVVTSEHSYHQASRWIYDNIPRGSAILGVHWDDKLPLHLPGFSPREYEYRYEGQDWELAIYEPDTPGKLSRMFEQLNAADYLIFPTQRIPGSIPRIPNEQPHSTALLQLLFAGQLGYELVASFKTQPGIGPFELNTDLADESLSVYDHPKITIFRNVQRLSADELKRRVLDPTEYYPLPSREEILMTNAENRKNPADFDVPVWRQILNWYLVILLLSVVVLPILQKLAPQNLDCAYAFSKVFSLVIPAVLAWNLSAAGVITTGPAAAWFSLLLLLILMTLLGLNWRQVFNADTLKSIARVEIVFLLYFCSFLLFRAYQPEIYWGEKPMDFAFLNYFIRGPQIPPQDPWVAGQVMNYYYLGFYIYAYLHHLSAVDSNLGFNLAVVSSGAFLVCALLAVIRFFSSSFMSAAIGAVAIAIVSNLEWLNLLLVKSEQVDFDSFWATTRLFTTPAITEYPVWSQIFADLHPHVMSQPIITAAIGLVLMLFKHVHARGIQGVFSGNSSWLAVFLGMSFGILFAINTWDAISLTVIIACAILVMFVSHLQARSAHTHFLQKFNYSLAAAGLICAAALLVSWPYWRQFGAASNPIGLGWVRDNEFNSLWQLIRHLGIFFVPILLYFILRFVRDRNQTSGVNLRIAALLSILPFILAAVSSASGTVNLPLGILLFSSLLTFLAWSLLLSKNLSRLDLIAATLCVAGGVLVFCSELVFLIDRMNTIFKTYQTIWIVFGIAAVCACIQLREHSDLFAGRGAIRLAWRWSFEIVIAVMAFGMLGTLANLIAIANFQRVPGPRPTLNGAAFLEMRDGDESRLIAWMRKNIKGLPTILEAQGSSYGDATRVTMHTGLPTVLGWEHHVKQRGTAPIEVERRREAVREIYQTNDIRRARELLCSYGVSYVFLGSVERAAYQQESLRKFFDNSLEFPLVKQFGPTALVATRCKSRINTE